MTTAVKKHAFRYFILKSCPILLYFFSLCKIFRPGLWFKLIKKSLAYWSSWTLDFGLWTLDSVSWTLNTELWTLNSGRRTLDTAPWMLDSGRWNLDAGPYTLSLDSGHWTLLLSVSERYQNPVSNSAWLNYWKFIVCKFLKTSWSRLLCRDYRFWRGYF